MAEIVGSFDHFLGDLDVDFLVGALFPRLELSSLYSLSFANKKLFNLVFASNIVSILYSKESLFYPLGVKVVLEASTKQYFDLLLEILTCSPQLFYESINPSMVIQRAISSNRFDLIKALLSSGKFSFDPLEHSTLSSIGSSSLFVEFFDYFKIPQIDKYLYSIFEGAILSENIALLDRLLSLHPELLDEKLLLSVARPICERCAVKSFVWLFSKELTSKESLKKELLRQQYTVAYAKKGQVDFLKACLNITGDLSPHILSNVLNLGNLELVDFLVQHGSQQKPTLAVYGAIKSGDITYCEHLLRLFPINSITKSVHDFYMGAAVASMKREMVEYAMKSLGLEMVGGYAFYEFFCHFSDKDSDYEFWEFLTSLGIKYEGVNIPLLERGEDEWYGVATYSCSRSNYPKTARSLQFFEDLGIKFNQSELHAIQWTLTPSAIDWLRERHPEVIVDKSLLTSLLKYDPKCAAYLLKFKALDETVFSELRGMVSSGRVAGLYLIEKTLGVKFDAQALFDDAFTSQMAQSESKWTSVDMSGFQWLLNKGAKLNDSHLEYAVRKKLHRSVFAFLAFNKCSVPSELRDALVAYFDSTLDSSFLKSLLSLH